MPGEELALIRKLRGGPGVHNRIKVLKAKLAEKKAAGGQTASDRLRAVERRVATKQKATENFEALAKSLPEFCNCENLSFGGLNISMEAAHILTPALLQMLALRKVRLDHGSVDLSKRFRNEHPDQAARLHIKEQLEANGIEVRFASPQE